MSNNVFKISRGAMSSSITQWHAWASRGHQCNSSDHKAQVRVHFMFVSRRLRALIFPSWVTKHRALHGNRISITRCPNLPTMHALYNNVSRNRSRFADSSSCMKLKLTSLPLIQLVSLSFNIFFPLFAGYKVLHFTKLLARARARTETAAVPWWPTVCSFPKADGDSPSSDPAPPACYRYSPLGSTPRRNPVPLADRFQLRYPKMEVCRWHC